MEIENIRNIDIEDIDEIDLSDDEDYIRAPKRYIRDWINPFEFYDNREFKRRFRFSKQSILYGILPQIENELIRKNNRGLPISPLCQLLICLRFYATGSFQVCNSYVMIQQNMFYTHLFYNVMLLI